MMNTNSFAKVENELRALGELIKTRQEEKQGVLDEFEMELKRFKAGEISEDTLESSIKKKNKELERLDNAIMSTIKKILESSKKINELIQSQKPVKYTVKKDGISGGDMKKKKPAKKKLTKKKVTKKTSKKKVGSKKAAKRVLKKRSMLKKSANMGKKMSKPKITKAEVAREMKAEKKMRK